jgi:hypothetical protein
MNGNSASRRFTPTTFRIRLTTIRVTLVRGALPALAGTLVLVGCGGGNTAGTSAAGASASATASGGLSAFQACLKQHGVTIAAGPSGARPTGSISPSALPTGSPRPGASFAGTNSAAFKDCGKYAPAGFAGGANRAISSSALAAFKSCLSSNGVKVTGSTASQIRSELRKSTGKTATAFHTCQVLLQPAAPTPSASS